MNKPRNRNLRNLNESDLNKCCDATPTIVDHPLYEIKCHYCGTYVGGFEFLSLAVLAFNQVQQLDNAFWEHGVHTDGKQLYADDLDIDGIPIYCLERNGETVVFPKKEEPIFEKEGFWSSLKKKFAR